MTQQETMSQ